MTVPSACGDLFCEGERGQRSPLLVPGAGEGVKRPGGTNSLTDEKVKIGSGNLNKNLIFDLWWKTQVDEKNAKRLMEDTGELKEYLAYKRLFAKYALSESEEKIINTLDVTGISALVKLYDKITNVYEYKMKIGNKKKTMKREESE